ncbi:biotin--[acetyl-CoA-carboxylase] ligase [Halovenus sp. WSH3]|uniref:Biotin--[acetyl-CoA-carboxylase] ligase n=1 Tax=Halovenus carboxidivorans TaxID=2692199 RepID=A0A6B0T218_9EURY|nr:biotin--[acetyl-CoA-carboxylase] ligase [Halovenus carboxidivorans]MXR51197.1 biotin--[acetyl-CoA-carboxylase] ligase [Halovenus carboxidivorans]
MHSTRKQVLDAVADGPVSGPDLAADLDISRAAVWNHIEALREEGFTIDSGPDGYTLEAVPEFGGPAIEYGLDAPLDVEYHDEIGSTNERARELAAAGRSDTVVVADRQTGGRARLDREWVSPSGGIWASILIRPEVPPARAPLYTLVAAVATARAARHCGADATIKWPNDVRVGGRKLAGILTEMEGEADRISWLVVGIGLNANVDPADLPGDQPATSLQSEVGTVDRRAVTQHLLEEFWTLSTARPETVMDGWRDLSSTLGKRVRVDTPDGRIVGEAVDITVPGTLIVETDTGTREVSAGDCEHLRPADS